MGVLSHAGHPYELPADICSLASIQIQAVRDLHQPNTLDRRMETAAGVLL